jgi:pimeloyl-ACP methyl ester carboxylesterase
MVLLLLLTISSSNAADTSVQNIKYDKILTQFKYPFPVSNFIFKTQNQSLTMAYMDVGASKATNQNNKQKVAVLLHGKNFAGFYWQSIAQDLVSNGYRVIIPDQIGFGKSSKPSHYQYSFTQLALNTQGLLKELSIKDYTLVGHSMGGMLAVNMAYLYKDSVSKLVLINPIGLEPYLDYVQVKDTNFFYKRELNKTVNGARKYQKKNYYAGNWHKDYEALLTPLKGWLNGPDWQVIAWNNALTYAPIFNEDITPKLAKITTPTHLIIGTRDTTGPGRGWKKNDVKSQNHKLGNYKKLGKAAAASMQNATLYELDGLGHMPQFEDYKKFSEVFFKVVD